MKEPGAALSKTRKELKALEGKHKRLPSEKKRKLKEACVKAGGKVARKVVVLLAGMIGLGSEVDSGITKAVAVLQEWYEKKSEAEQVSGVRRLEGRGFGCENARMSFEKVGIALVEGWKVRESRRGKQSISAGRERGEVAAGRAIVALMDGDEGVVGDELMMKAIENEDVFVSLAERGLGVVDEEAHLAELDRISGEAFSSSRLSAMHIAKAHVGLDKAMKEIEKLKSAWDIYQDMH